MAINPMEYGSKDVVLDVLRTERAKFYDVIDDPDNWYVDTRCEGWQVRDIVGHMIDVSEGYLTNWDLALEGKEAPPPLGWVIMATKLNEGALAFRSLSREEAIARLKTASAELMRRFEALSEDEWYNYQFSHPFSGPLPTMFYAPFQIMDYGVHSWDMRWGLGEKDGELDERTAGVLVPYMFIIWQYSVDQEAAEGVEMTYAIIIDGEWGGHWKATVKDGQFNYEETDDLSDVQATFHYLHPSDMVLTTYQRIQGGITSGDPEVIDKAYNVFFNI